MEVQMPIVNMTSEPKLPEGAVNLQGHDHVSLREMSAEVIGPRPYWTYQTHNGKCLFERERNTHDDSDFFMTVWNDETNQPEEILFASTRGWTYPCLASRPDATDEVKAKYQAWQKQQAIQRRKNERKAKALVLKTLRNDTKRIAKANNLNYSKLLKLRKTGKLNEMLALFGTRIRSNFKLSLRNQLINWVNGQSKYDQPFSPKQMQYL